MQAYSLGRIVDAKTFNYLSRYFDVNEFPPFLVKDNDPWSNLKAEFPELGIGKGTAGCMLGHQSIWKHFVESATESEYALVLESDVVITGYGKRYLINTLETFSKSNRNVLHLGSHESLSKFHSPKLILSTSQTDLLFDFASRSILKLMPTCFRRNYFHFSTHAYLISHRFASFLVKGQSLALMPVDVYLQSLSQTKGNLIDTTLQILFRQSKLRPSLIDDLGR